MKASNNKHRRYNKFRIPIKEICAGQATRTNNDFVLFDSVKNGALNLTGSKCTNSDIN